MFKYMLSILVCITSLMYGQPSIEQVRDDIVSTLQKNSVQALEQFNAFYKQFDTSVHLFFDRANKQSLAEHIKRMEGEIAVLNKVCSDAQFKSVCAVLKEHRDHVLDLVAILKQYVNSFNSVGFALQVKKFEFLLPHDIKKRGHFSLFRSLHHRLMC